MPTVSDPAVAGNGQPTPVAELDPEFAARIKRTCVESGAAKEDWDWQRLPEGKAPAADAITVVGLGEALFALGPPPQDPGQALGPTRQAVSPILVQAGSDQPMPLGPEWWPDFPAADADDAAHEAAVQARCYTEESRRQLMAVLRQTPPITFVIGTLSSWPAGPRMNAADWLAIESSHGECLFGATAQHTASDLLTAAIASPLAGPMPDYYDYLLFVARRMIAHRSPHTNEAALAADYAARIHGRVKELGLSLAAAEIRKALKADMYREEERAARAQREFSDPAEAANKVLEQLTRDETLRSSIAWLASVIDKSDGMRSPNLWCSQPARSSCRRSAIALMARIWLDVALRLLLRRWPFPWPLEFGWPLLPGPFSGWLLWPLSPPAAR